MAPATHSNNDPLAWALRPPPGETHEERQLRLKLEADAKAVSDSIDQQLQAEREAIRKKRANNPDVKLLLLGQSESGKSTLKKQFQLLYAPQSLDSERAAWRPVIYLNIVATVRSIIDALVDDDEGYDSGRDPGRELSRTPSPSGSRGTITHELANLKMRLLPFIALEDILAEKLAGGVPVSDKGPLVRAGWQLALRTGKPSKPKTPSEGDRDAPRPSIGTQQDTTHARLFAASRADVKDLWHHPMVRGLMKRRRLRLDDSANFFLDAIDRIATLDYLPSTDDILHARLQTLGISESLFEISIARKPATWRLFDVGGSRGQRQSWAPYFDDADAIIFLAPISAFDQYLEEDHRVNRIDDSLQLFGQICSNDLLKNCHLVLFLNKTDILRAKLQAGAKVKKYITSFGDRPNEFNEVSQYFRAHFLQVHRKNNSDKKRVLYVHMTSVVDTTTTQDIIMSVRDAIFRGYLKESVLV